MKWYKPQNKPVENDATSEAGAVRFCNFMIFSIFCSISGVYGGINLSEFQVLISVQKCFQP